ncbi:CcdB family protein [Aliarcobacter vitoriensis]|uniref:CcdB family protein n=1 Tax=Aliarcobacter vitoriensis TaxID=2011099 RepID=UPI003AAC9BDB
MAQFDVYENINEMTKEKFPYIIDIQNNILKDLSSRVVIPMRKSNKTINILNPNFSINGIEVVLSTQEISTISTDNFGNKVCSLKDKADEILNSIDFLITGF